MPHRLLSRRAFVESILGIGAVAAVMPSAPALGTVTREPRHVSVDTFMPGVRVLLNGIDVTETMLIIEADERDGYLLRYRSDHKGRPVHHLDIERVTGNVRIVLPTDG